MAEFNISHLFIIIIIVLKSKVLYKVFPPIYPHNNLR